MNFLQWIRINKTKPAAQGLITFIVCHLMLPLSMLTHAGPVVDPNADISFQPVIRDYSGIPVIDIVAPDTAGLSHNKYRNFDIDAKGLVFNNSLVNGNSQLVQNLLANPNFGARTATTILNEVTGASDSQLKGITEIFGDSANLIIANPNGITCNGCGFLNTERLTLTTGTPSYSNQNLRFDVNDGRITFDEEGLSYRHIPESVDLLSRYITMNGELIIPGELNLITGRYLADYQKIVSGELRDAISEKAPSGASTEALAIDGTVFGAMQAGRISIMATEDGLGVKSDGYLASRADDLFIESAGGVLLRNADSFGSMNITAQDAVELADEIKANTDIVISGQAYKSLTTTSLTSKNIDISAINKAQIAGDITTNKLELSAKDIESSAKIVSVNTLNIEAIDSIDVTDSEIETENLLLNSRNLTISDSDIKALELSAFADESMFISSTSTEGLNIEIDADILETSNLSIKSENIGITSKDQWNSSEDRIYALNFTKPESDLDEESEESENAETITHTFNLKANNASLTGTLIQSEVISLNVDNEFSGSASALIANDVTLDADSISLTNGSTVIGVDNVQMVSNHDTSFDGTLSTTSLSLTANDAQTLTGEINATNSILLKQQTLNLTSGVLSSNDISIESYAVNLVASAISALNVDVDSIDSMSLSSSVIDAGNADLNSSLIAVDFESGVVANTASLTSDDLINDGVLIVADSLNIKSTASVGGQGSYSSDNIISMTTGDLSLEAELIAANLTVVADSVTTNSGSNTEAADILITSGRLNLAGDLSGNNIHLQAQMPASDDLVGSYLLNDGIIAANESLRVTGYDTLNNSADLASQNSLVITDIGAFENSLGASIFGEDSLELLVSETLTNAGLISTNTINLRSNNMVNDGLIGAFTGDLLATTSTVNNGHIVQLLPEDTITSTDALNLNLGALTNNDTASIEAINGAINASSATNHGVILDFNSTGTAQEGLGFSLTSDNGLINTGNIQLKGDLAVATGNVSNSGAATLYANDINLNGGSLNNYGEFVGSSLTFNGSAIYNDGKVWVKEVGDINARRLNNINEFFMGSGALDVAGLVENSGTMVFVNRGENIDINVGSFENKDSLIFNNTNSSLTFDSIFTNTGNVTSFSDSLSFISSSGVFNNGTSNDVGAIDTYQVCTTANSCSGGNMSFSLGSGTLNNNNAGFTGTEFNEEVTWFAYHYKGNGGDTDRHTWEAGYRLYDQETGLKKSSISVAGNLTVNADSFINDSANINVGDVLTVNTSNPNGFMNINKQTFITEVSLWWRRTQDQSESRSKLREWRAAYDTGVGIEQAEAELVAAISRVSPDTNEKGFEWYFDVNALNFDSKFSGYSEGSNLTEYYQDNPNGLGIINAGDFFGTGNFVNEGSFVVDSLTYGDSSTVEGEQSSFSNQTNEYFLDLTDSAPTNAVNLLALFAPETSFQALSDASVAGSKTPEQIAAQAELQSQLDALGNSNTENGKAINAGHGSNLFNLDPDILNLIIADTEFELQPYYIFERIDESQIPEVTPVFFFDPYQEAQLLTQAALQQTGTAYFSDDWDSSAEQRQALYDNTVLYLNENQDVEIGTPLSEDVIAVLNAPMMWYVSMDIGGQSQLVPTVYLPQATLDQITTPEAGSIIADTMDVNVDEFANSGNIKVAGVASIYAKSFENQRNVFTFGDDKNYGTTVSDGGNISAGTLAVTSEGDINNNGGSLKTTGDMSLVAGGDINFNAVEVNRRSQNGENVTENTRFLLSDIVAGGNVTFDAEGNLVSQAAQVNVDGDATINAENILLGGVVERDYEKTVEKRNGTFSSTKITKTSESLDFVGSDFNIGGDANLTAGNAIVLKGSTVDAEGDVDVYAENGITVEAGISQQTDTRLREDSNSVRMATTDSGSITQTAVASGISSGGNLSLDTNGDINILASELSSGGDMVIGDFDLLLDDEGLPVLNEAGQFMAADGTTVGNVNIGTVALKDESWSVRETSLKGPLQDLATVAAAAMSMTGTSGLMDAAGISTEITVASSESTRTQSTTNVGSELNTDGNLLLNSGGDVSIAGSQVNVGESAVIQADNVLVTAVENTTTTTHSQSEHTIDSADMNVGSQEVTVGGFTDTQHTETTTTTQTTLGMAGINVGLNYVDENGNAAMPENPDERATLSIAATNDIDILSSEINVIGDAQLTANNITVGGLQETTTTTHEDETITTTTSVGVKNAYVDTVYAVDAVTKAAEGVEEAEALLRDAEKRIKDGSLAESALDDYKINLAAATSQLAQATLNLASSGATAAGTTGTGGFYMSGSASTTETKNTSTSTQSNFVGSNINVSGNATFNANKALNIIGSTAQVGGHAQLDAEDITITAGQNTYSEESTSSTKTASASVSTAAPTSGNGSLSNSDTIAGASGTTHTNSFFSAGSLGSNSDNMTIAGATVMTEGDLDIDTNNLVIKSLQDTHQSNSETTGGSVGVGSSAKAPSSIGYNESSSTSDSAMVTQQTMLIGGTSGKGEVNLTADKTTIAGAVVASATINDDAAQGCANAAGAGCTGAVGTLTDNGNLNIVTDELIIEDIQDHNTSSTEGFSLDTAVSGTGTTTVGATNLGNNLEQTTFATLGAGNITKKDGTAHDVSGVNRDLNNTQEVTLDQQTGGLDATVTVDQRLASEEGRDQIKEDFVKSDMILDTIELMATTDKVGITDFFSETGKKHTTYEAIKEEIRTNPDLAKALQNPDLSAEDKEVMLNQLTHTVMEELGYETEGYENKIVARDDDLRAGFYSDETGDAYINDHNIYDTEGLVTTAGHESSHAMDAQDPDSVKYSEEGKETYSSSYGENFGSYTNLALDINGHDAGMAQNNNHVGNDSILVNRNNQEYGALDKAQGDDLLPLILAGGAIVLQGIDLGLTAKDGYDLNKAIEEGRTEDAQQIAAELGVGFATEAIPGNKILVKLGKIVGAGEDAVKSGSKVDSPDVDVQQVTKEFGEGKIGPEGNAGVNSVDANSGEIFDPGLNITPNSTLNNYPSIGANGTFVTNSKTIEDIIGSVPDGATDIRITRQQANALESDLGLNPGSLEQSNTLSIVSDIPDRCPRCPVGNAGNDLFLGGGEGLPGGGPELVIDSIPSAGGDGIRQITIIVED